MPIHLRLIAYGLFLFALIVPGVQAAPADDLESIRFGESALMYASGLIQKSTPQDGFVNVITGDNQTTGDRMQLGQYDTLYLKLKNPAEAAIGDLYTIFKRTRKVFHPVTREYMGYLVNRLAIVEVTQIDRGLATVKTLRAYSAISPGDPFFKFSLPVEAPAGASSDETMGVIVELQADMGLTLVAQRNVVYIDRGTEDGVKAGDRMDIIRTGGNLPPRVVGEIKVLFAESHTASALITKSTARLFKGDRFRLKSREAEVVPVSQPVQPALDMPVTQPAATPNLKSQFQQVQPASRETRFTLDDLTRQLRYESGEATIKPEGVRALDQLVEYLKGVPADQMIRVEGHADNMEIGPSLKSIFPTNWDLSKARASGVLRYLVEKGGIDSARISSLGFGDSRPIASNASEAGRQRNRRVDIILYQPESAKAPVEEVKAPSQPSDQGYQVSGLEASKPAPQQPMADDVAVPAKPVVDSSTPPTSDQVPAAPPVTDSLETPSQDAGAAVVPSSP